MNKQKLQEAMKKVIATANQVLEEASKAQPNETEICDLAIEKMDELREEIDSAVFGANSHLEYFNTDTPGCVVTVD